MDGCEFAMVHEEAPGVHVRSEILLLLAVVSLICGRGPHVNETWCAISHAICDLAALARGAALVFFWKFAALVIDLYFFNMQSEWIAPVVITRERI